jgi:hypothetical protein
VIPRVHVTECPSTLVSLSPKVRELIRLGWKRSTITIYSGESSEKLTSSIMYLPPNVSKPALERMFELWAM